MLNNLDIDGNGIFNGFELLIYTFLFAIIYFKTANWFYNKYNFWFMPNREAYKKYWN